jgi:hypothetical protein
MLYCRPPEIDHEYEYEYPLDRFAAGVNVVEDKLLIEAGDPKELLVLKKLDQEFWYEDEDEEELLMALPQTPSSLNISRSVSFSFLAHSGGMLPLSLILIP